MVAAILKGRQKSHDTKLDKNTTIPGNTATYTFTIKGKQVKLSMF